MKDNFCQIVLIEDERDDAELVELQLEKIEYPYHLHVVTNLHKLKELNKEINPDLIISDYNLKEYNGMDILRYVRTYKEYVPFILISGFIGEEKAVSTVKEGADDYIMKDNLERLTPTAERLLGQIESKRQQQLKEKIFESIFETSEVGVIVMNSDLQIVLVNNLIEEMTGYTEAELIGKTKLDLYKADSRQQFKKELSEGFSTQNSFTHEWILNRKDGAKRTMHSSISYIRISDERNYAVSLVTDVTEAQRANRLRKQTEFISGVGSWQYDFDNNEIYLTPRMYEIYGIKEDESNLSLDFLMSFYKEPDRVKIRDAMNETIESKEEYKLEAEMVSANGEEKIVEITGKPIESAGKTKTTMLVGTMEDITEEKEREKEIKKLSMVARQTQSSVIITDVEGYIEWVNEAFTRMTGFKQEEVIGKKPGDFLQGPKTDSQVVDRMAEAIKKREAFTEELINYRKNGEKYWIRLVVTPIKNDEGEITEFFSIQEDITQRKQAEIGLRDAEQKLRNIVEHSTNLFYQHDRTGRFTYLSPQAKEFLGISPDEVDDVWTNYITDNPVNEIGEKLTNKALETGEQQEPYKLELKKRNGETLWVLVNESPIIEEDNTVSIVGSLTDITDLKEAQDKIENSRQRLIEAQRVGKIGHWDFDVETGEITWSEEMYHIYERDISMGSPTYEELLKYYPKDDRVVHNHYVTRAIEEAKDYEFEITLLAAKEKPKFVRALGIVTQNEEGKVIRLHGTVQDITREKETEQQLVESYRRVEEAQKIGNIGDWVFDVENEKISWSDMLYEIFERDLKQGPPTVSDISNTYYREHKTELLMCIERAIKHGKSYDKDFIIITETGEKKYTRTVGQPVMDANKKVVKLHGIVQDITERKKAELNLIKKDKRIRNIIDSIEGIVLRYELFPDGTDNFDFISEGVKNIFNVSAEEVIRDAKAIWNKILEEDVEEVVKSIEESAKFLTIWDHVYRISVDNEIKWIHGRGTPQKQPDGTVRWDTVLVDITAQKKAEVANEILLQEVHHRVKNNFAIISGLLQLEEFETEDDALKYPLLRSQNRIHSMAKVHELLYREKDFSNIRLGSYLKELVEIIHSNMMADENNVITHISAKDVILNVNSAIPLGILLNELLTNSFKYAFPDGKKGKIEIEARKVGDMFEISYKDNGVGFKKGVSLEKGGSMGLLLINTLLKQLEAKYEIHTKGKFELNFKFKSKSRGSQSIM